MGGAKNGLREKAAKRDDSLATIKVLVGGNEAAVESFRERNHGFAKRMFRIIFAFRSLRLVSRDPFQKRFLVHSP
jgi:hypothetical protein